MTKTVRKAASTGPCKVLGEFLNETAMYFVFRDYLGRRKLINKWRPATHIEPCDRCPKVRTVVQAEEWWP
jgi:hypothetical protein